MKSQNTILTSEGRLNRRRFLRLGLASTSFSTLVLSSACVNGEPQYPVRMRNAGGQTIAFELPNLPGEEFRIVIPEVISDATQPIVPWGLQSPDFDIAEDVARWAIEIPDVVRMEAEVRFSPDRIDAYVKTTNLSPRAWEKLNAFTCFAYYAAPSFFDPQMTRTYFPVNSQWKSVSQLFSEHDPGSGPYTFFRVAGGPRLEELWACRQIKQFHPQIVDQGCACVVSKDGKSIVGMTTPTPAYVFVNRKETCIHADPLMGTVPPGGTCVGSSTIYVFRGTLADFAKRCREPQVSRKIG